MRHSWKILSSLAITAVALSACSENRAVPANQAIPNNGFNTGFNQGWSNTGFNNGMNPGLNTGFNQMWQNTGFNNGMVNPGMMMPQMNNGLYTQAGIQATLGWNMNLNPNLYMWNYRSGNCVPIIQPWFTNQRVSRQDCRTDRDGCLTDADDRRDSRREERETRRQVRRKVRYEGCLVIVEEACSGTTSTVGTPCDTNTSTSNRALLYLAVKGKDAEALYSRLQVQPEVQTLKSLGELQSLGYDVDRLFKDANETINRRDQKQDRKLWTKSGRNYKCSAIEIESGKTGFECHLEIDAVSGIMMVQNKIGTSDANSATATGAFTGNNVYVSNNGDAVIRIDQAAAREMYAKMNVASKRSILRPSNTPVEVKKLESLTCYKKLQTVNEPTECSIRIRSSSASSVAANEAFDLTGLTTAPIVDEATN